MRGLNSSLSIEEYCSSVSSGELRCEEAVADELENVRGYAESRNAFVSVFSGERGFAMARARQVDADARVSTLKGLPLTIKDNAFFGGFPTTDGSEAFADFVPSANATIVDNLLAAGCVPLGKTNLHEFALGVTGTSGMGGPIRNPVDENRISGGSSGGSAVSVRLSEVPLLSLGSDTGGSVRIPAALCGVAGFKPSWGALSTAGLFPLSASLDHVGLLAKNAADVAYAFRAITGTRVRQKSRWKVGVPSGYFVDDMDAHVSRAFWGSIEALKASGTFEFRDVKVPGGYGLYSRARAAIMCREASWFYEAVLRSPETRRRVHKDVLALMDWGSRVGMLQYMRSLNLRTEATVAMVGLLRGLDSLLLPTCLMVAPKVEEALGKETGEIRSMLLRNTELFNTSGLPAMSIPMSSRFSRLPTGLQAVGGPGRDGDLLGLSMTISAALHTRSRD